MAVEFSCPTLILLPMPALPVPWNVEGSAPAAVTGSAESNGAATPAAASLSVSRRVKGVFIEHSPMLRIFGRAVSPEASSDRSRFPGASIRRVINGGATLPPALLPDTGPRPSGDPDCGIGRPAEPSREIGHL